MQRQTALVQRQLFPNVQTHPGRCGWFRTKTTFVASTSRPAPAPGPRSRSIVQTDPHTCSKDEVGYITINDNGACGPSALKPTGDQVATLIAQGTGQDASLLHLYFSLTPVANSVSSFSLYPLAPQIMVLPLQLPSHKPLVPLQPPQVFPQPLLVSQVPNPLTLLAV